MSVRKFNATVSIGMRGPLKFIAHQKKKKNTHLHGMAFVFNGCLLLSFMLLLVLASSIGYVLTAKCLFPLLIQDCPQVSEEITMESILMEQRCMPKIRPIICPRQTQKVPLLA